MFKKVRHNYAAKQNISTSFDLKNFHCNTCTGEGHVVLRREGERVAARELAPVAFVLSDQNFAPSLPAEDGGECLKIIRVEDAGLQELVTLFLEATRGFIMPAGTLLEMGQRKSSRRGEVLDRQWKILLQRVEKSLILIERRFQ
jgi:hypothetical protein